MKVLLCDSDQIFSRVILSALSDIGAKCDVITSGSDCQMSLLRDPPRVLVLDVLTKGKSAFEIAQFVQDRKLPCKVILTCNRAEDLEKNELSIETIKKLGISQVLLKPVDGKDFISCLQAVNKKDDFFSNEEAPQDLSSLTLENMSKIKVFPLFAGKTTPISFYQKKPDHTFEKIFSRGQSYDAYPEGLCFYYKNSDRMAFIQFLNDVMEQDLFLMEMKAENRLETLKLTIDEFLKEAMIKGLDLMLVNHSKRICSNMLKLIERDPKIKEAIKIYKEENFSNKSRFFLITFFTTLIAKNIEWQSPRVTELASLGGLLHDIGISKLEHGIRMKDHFDMSAEEKLIYDQHVTFGAKLIRDANLPEPVAQIVQQHHELVNGEGYPNKLGGIKIYPMAKIVSLADGFSTFIIENKLTPIDGLKVFLSDRRMVERFDASAIKALIKGFLKEKKDAA